jgi:DUF1365 family protein
MQSCIYEGRVRHRRLAPERNAFRYSLFMMYLDLDELPAVFAGTSLWSAERPALAWFRRRDYLGDPERSLAASVRELVSERTGRRPRGPIRLLTHLRYFGYCFNPVSFYYCFDAGGRQVETIVAEITNTPYNERHRYVLDETRNAGTADRKRYRFKKSFFVSPFIDMDVDYDWRFTTPGRRLLVHMDNRNEGGKFFDATLTLSRREVSPPALNRLLVRYPWMTAKVIGAIYFQALRLWLKRAKIHDHVPPGRAADLEVSSS